MIQYKSPRSGGATRIKEVFEELRKRQPSEALLEILKKKPSKKQERSDKKIAKPRRPRVAEL